MAVPAWTLSGVTNVLEVDADENFSAFGGGSAGLNLPEPDFWIRGSECWSKNAWKDALKGMMHDEAGTDLAVGTNEVCMVWQFYGVRGALTASSDAGETGEVVRAGTDDDANYWYFEVGDGVSLLFETWVPWSVNWDLGLGVQVGSPSGTIDWIGGGCDITVNGPTKGSPFAIGNIRYGRFEVQYTDGETDDFQTFAKAEAHANDNSRRWGCLEFRQGIYLMQGFHSFGVSGTLCDMRDADEILFIRDTPFAPPGFNRFEVINASTNIEWTNILITSLGTQSPGTFVVTDGAVDLQSCQFTGMGTFDFLIDSVAQNCTFRGCDQITAPGTDMVGTSIIESSVASDTGALVWDVNQDPDGELDDMTFQAFDIGISHAIEFGTNAPLTMTLRGITFTNYGADGTVTSVLLFPDTGSDVTWTINVVDVTGTVSFKKVRSGDTVNIVVDPVTLTLTVTDIDTGSPISGARALAEVTSSAGGFPFQDSVSIVQTSGTATVTHTAHGLATNDFVLISGAAEEGYNKVGQITVTGASEYTYTVPSGTASPATGSPVSTFVVISGTTDGSGVIAATYAYAADQPFTGRVRDASPPAPFYKTSPLTGTIDSANGLSVAVQLIADD